MYFYYVTIMYGLVAFVAQSVKTYIDYKKSCKKSPHVGRGTRFPPLFPRL